MQTLIVVAIYFDRSSFLSFKSICYFQGKQIYQKFILKTNIIIKILKKRMPCHRGE